MTCRRWDAKDTEGWVDIGAASRGRLQGPGENGWLGRTMDGGGKGQARDGPIERSEGGVKKGISGGERKRTLYHSRHSWGRSSITASRGHGSVDGDTAIHTRSTDLEDGIQTD